MIIDQPGIYDDYTIKGSRDESALVICSSDVEIYLFDTLEALKYGIRIEPMGQYETIENIHLRYCAARLSGGTGVAVASNKGYIRNCHLYGIELFYNGLTYTNSGAHGLSLYAGGQTLSGGQERAAWEQWRLVKGTEYVMTVGMTTENTRYTEMSVNNTVPVFYPRGRLQPGVQEQLDIGQFAIDSSGRFTDIYVNIGLTLSEMNSRRVVFKLGSGGLDGGVHIHGGFGNGQFDSHGEAAMFVFDDGVNECTAENLVAKNAQGAAFINNGGRGNKVKSLRSMNCALQGGREFGIGALSEDLDLISFRGEKDVAIEYPWWKGIKNINTPDYKRI